MPDTQLLTAVNALVPGLTVTGLLLVVIFWLLGGKLRSQREYTETVARIEAERVSDQKHHEDEVKELRERCNRYEQLAWGLVDVAKATSKTAAARLTSDA